MEQASLSSGSLKTATSVVESIGQTPIVELHKIVPANCGRILAKLEWANPTGSMKDRMAKTVIEAASADGRLPPGGTVVEYTAGTTGVSLAPISKHRSVQARAQYSGLKTVNDNLENCMSLSTAKPIDLFQRYL